MVILFILLLLLAIWAAFKFGGVRKVDEASLEDRDEEKRAKEEERSRFRPGGGRFGGGGASGSWGHDGDDRDKRH